MENLSSSIVREFLNKKKCMKTLQVLDDEWPRPENSISSRAKLAEALCIETWVNNNKTSPTPLKTMLEVILCNVVQLRKYQRTSFALVKPRLDIDQYKTQTNVHTPDYSPFKQTSNFPKPNTADAATTKMFSLTPKEVNDTAKSNKLPVSLTLDSVEDVDINDLLDRKQLKVKPISTTYDFTFQRKDKSCGNESNVAPSKVNPVLHQSNLALKNQSNEATVNDDLLMNVHDDGNGENLHAESVHNSAQKFINTNSQQQFVRKIHLSERSSKVSSAPHHPRNQAGEKFSYELAKNLKMLFFGSTKYAFSTEWCEQSFAFGNCDDRPKELRFGIIQNKGGPCGVLAALQGTVMKHILFSSEAVAPTESTLNVSDAFRSACLIQSITDILWRAGDNKRATLAIMSPRKQFTGIPLEYRADGITEHVVTVNAFSKAELQTAVKQNIKSLEHGKGGCILLLYSAILSRGLNLVKSDMDDANGKLMGAHNYCTQEMINLLLIGRATSNAFNDTMQLDEHTKLKGVHTQSEIGMLSLFEHYGSCKIGDYYKTPKFPIWLICSESHFTVVFGLNFKLASKFLSPVSFDLYYYDGLANQDELIRLTVDTSTEVDDSDERGDLVPPLEHCLRTKWPRAYISWNDTEPLL